MRFNALPDDNIIVKDYKILQDFAIMAATVVDSSIINKRYQKHVPHRSKDCSLFWARDNWYAFDGLPREFRDMINIDPNPDDTLKTSLELWESIKVQADKAMDRIISYEKSIYAIDNLPDWLKTDSDEAEIIRELRAIRLNELEKYKEEQAAKRAELLAKNKTEKYRKYFRETISTTYSVEGRKLSDVQLLDTSGMRPHEIQEALKTKRIKELKFTKHERVLPAGWYNVDVQKAADKADRTPPDKVHPIHFKRGRNF